VLVIDLKDCFFTIALHPEDTVRFAFTIPSTNKAEPSKRYEWTVLPQGMKNSPTMCQMYVAWALMPLRKKLKDTIIYHYMDDILFSQKEPFTDADVDQIS
ncbi:POK8 protein, partial [Hydrobates tethys]|nr:POK8 protein [Oceanodroma tethys]